MAVDSSFFERLNQRKFRKMASVGKKPRRLVIHPSLRSFLNRIVDGPTLQRNFERIHIFDGEFQFSSNTCYAFLIPPEISVIRDIFAVRAESQMKPFIELWVQPRINDVLRAFLCDTSVKGSVEQSDEVPRMAPMSIARSFPSPNENVASAGGYIFSTDVEVYNLDMDLVPLDNDLLTMGSRYAFERLFYEGDCSVVSEVREAIAAFAGAGGFASVTCVGKYSVAVGKTLGGVSESQTAHLVLFDRTMDLITPLVTQMSYEGLLADFFGIDCGVIATETDSGTRLHVLSSASDAFFGELRSLNHSEAGDLIEERTRAVGRLGTSGGAGTGVDGMRAAARFALENQTLHDHLNLSQQLFQRMEKALWFKRMMNAETDILMGEKSAKTAELVRDMLEYGADLRLVLRHLCLDSLVNGGCYAKDKAYDALLRLLVFSYGEFVLPLVARLSELGLLVPNGQGQRWRDFVRQFRLFNSSWDSPPEEGGEQVAASYMGYVPLTVRIVEHLLQAGDDWQRVLEEFALKLGGAADHRGATDWSKGDVIVCIIGGCTHGEINALRRLGKQRDRGVQIVATEVCSTSEFVDHIAAGIPGWDPAPFII